jgi:hypothetical protein
MNHEVEEMRELLGEIEGQIPKLCRNSETQQLCRALKQVLPSLRAVVDLFGEEASGKHLPDALIELLTHLRDFKSKLAQDNLWLEG